MKTCRWCGKEGDWPEVCMSTRDMEDKAHDPVCDAALMNCGGGERVQNQIRSQKQKAGLASSIHQPGFPRTTN